ncbi:PQQ-binding-like beta-propeller repeat protein [Verrucomicrobiota bacterium]
MAELGLQTKCALHPDARVAGKCIQCGKPVCSICVTLRGYFCSDACSAAHDHRVLPPQETGPLSGDEMDRAGRSADVISTWLFKRIPLAVLVLGGLWFMLKLADRSGKESWKLVAPKGASFVNVIPHGDTVYGVRSDGMCLALNARTGEQKWAVKVSESGGGGSFFPFFGASSLGGSGLFMTNDVLVHKGWSGIKILDPEDGSELWQRKQSGWSAVPSVFGGGRMLTADLIEQSRRSRRSGSSLLASGNRTARLSCLDIKTGKSTWTRSYGTRNILQIGINDALCYCVSAVPASVRWSRCKRHRSVPAKQFVQCYDCKSEWTPPSRFTINVMESADGKPRWTGKMRSGAIEAVKLLQDRLVLITSHHFYIVGADGAKRALERLPGKSQRTDFSGDCVVFSTRDGSVCAYSTDDGSRLWAQKIEGWAWDLQVAGDSVYLTAGIPEEKSADKKAPDGTPQSPRALTPQQKMTEEAGSRHQGYSQKEQDAMRPSCRTLIRYDLASGKEHWREQDFVGQIFAQPTGYLCLLQGREAAGRFMEGTGAVVSSHLRRNGKLCWEFKINEATHSLTVARNKIYIITAPGANVLGAWSAKAEPGSKLRAINRRNFINYARKF